MELDDDRFGDEANQHADHYESNLPVFFGTPLVKETGELVTLRPFQVRAAQRLHGAFKGGFSAGYYNTVDTEEGWEPSSFISSRSDPHKELKRTGNRSAMPEDFMDDEDMAEFGIAPRKLTISSKYASERPKTGGHSFGLAFATKPSAFAVSLLKQWGWKEGYGVGPHLKQERNQWQKLQQLHYGQSGLMYNVPLPPSMSQEQDGFEDVVVHRYDTEAIIAEPKNDRKGMGYEGELQTNELKQLTESRAVGFLPSGQAFGIGIDADEDDVDIYASESMEKYDYYTGHVMNTKKIKVDVDELPRFVEGTFLQVQVTSFPDTPSLPKGYKPPRRSKIADKNRAEDLYGSKKFQKGKCERGKLLEPEQRNFLLGRKQFVKEGKSKGPDKVEEDDVLAAKEGRFGT
ncbi:hypothetical protein ACOME3_002906 [Neoechinorhynchus agilis]